MPCTIRIAMLNADTPVPVVRDKYPTYGAVFQHLLSAAASRIAPTVTISSQDFDIVAGKYPDNPATFDALLITGSASSSYDDVSWGKTLDAYVQMVYREYPNIKIFGSCYGHQMICQSLLREHGVKVQKDPSGWEIGVHKVTIDPNFRQRLGGFTSAGASSPFQAPLTPSGDGEDSVSWGLLDKPIPEQLMLQFVHADSVVLPPEGLPVGWVKVGSSKQCSVQGVYHPGRVLTYQGHFEFDRFINSETIKVFGAKWDPALLQSYLEAIDAGDNSLEAAEVVVKFLLEPNVSPDRTSGLITPPAS